jgi:hypothetical protein
MSLKETIKNQIIEIERRDLNALKEMYASYMESSDLEDESTPDPEDFSQKNQNQETALGLEVRINRQKQMIDSFLNLDFGPKEKVEPGALVLTSTLNFFIGITANMFDLEGKKYIGLNTEAPIYTALEGSKAGDVVEFNGQKYSIKEVL